MSFEKPYTKRKDWRKPYRHSQAIDRSCRPGGDCPWCRGNRRHQRRKLEERSRDQY